MATSKTPAGRPTGLPDVDPRIKTLFINNLAKAIGAGESPVNGYEIPASLTALGYTGAAKVMGVADHTVRHYWQADLLAGRSQSMPPPDVIINRIIQRADGTEDLEVLPGWTERTIREWMPVRVGTGNHTRGEDRRGNRNGRTGWRKANAEASA